jgi:hypothetical protein
MARAGLGAAWIDKTLARQRRPVPGVCGFKLLNLGNQLVNLEVLLGQLPRMARLLCRKRTALASQLPELLAQQLLQTRNLAHLLFKVTALPD